MFRRIRQQLRRIDYYSAHRTGTAWSQWMTRVLLATPFVGVAACIVIAVAVRRIEVVASVSGDLGVDAKRELVALPASVLNNDAPIGLTLAPYGMFEVRLERDILGWPIAAASRPRSPAIDINLYSVAGPGPDREPVESVQRGIDAVERLLASSTADEVIEYRGQAMRGSRWSMLAWVANWIGAFVASYLVMAIIVQCIRFVVFLAKRSAAKRTMLRVSRGLCPACGYETRGLEFSDRCPECGSILT
jgi:hypothetical protein